MHTLFMFRNIPSVSIATSSTRHSSSKKWPSYLQGISAFPRSFDINSTVIGYLLRLLRSLALKLGVDAITVHTSSTGEFPRGETY